MNDTPPTPIVVTPSTNTAAAGTFLRDILIVVAAFPILAKLIGARDIRGLLDWIGSNDGALVIAIVAPLVATMWRSILSKRRKAEFVTVAREVSDEVAIVQEKPVA